MNGVVEKNGPTSSPSSSSHLVKKLYGVPNERGGTNWLEQCPDYIDTTTQASDHALLVRYKEARAGIRKKALALLSIHIQSPFLKQLIRPILRRQPGENVDEEEPSFEAPFYSFFHQWATLQDARQREQGDNRRREIEALLDVLESEIGEDTRNAQNLARNGNITFRLLWTLFPPGCPCLAQWKGKEHCFLVNEAKYLKGEIEPSMAVELLFLDHDGDRYGWNKVSILIAPFSGSSKITGLPVVPLCFRDDASATLERLASRGTMSVDLLRGHPVYRSYEGPIRLHRGMDMEEQEVFVEGRIIIDSRSHSQQAARFCPRVFTIPHKLECLLSRDSSTKFVNTSSNSNEGSSDDTLLPVMENLNQHPMLSVGHSGLHAQHSSQTDEISPLKRHRWTESLFGIRTECFCRSVVRGYCLTSKSWAEFEVENVRAIEWNMHAFDALVMSPPRKRLVEALVKQQQDHKADADVDDIVQGKGQGLIMLLAGPPGTGKTLTAESIADRLKLPLYAVSASELGDTAKEIETQFGQVLRLAASWNAVLLLDEADAFLERRVDSPDARDRNKRVAAFLRILEYYKGILILTTNRIINFDDAFYSRIHLTLTFKALDQTFREGIWKNFLRGAEISDAELKVFAREELNGRQIKNVMKMARLLAKNEAAPLRANHVRDVLDVLKDDT